MKWELCVRVSAEGIYMGLEQRQHDDEYALYLYPTLIWSPNLSLSVPSHPNYFFLYYSRSGLTVQRDKISKGSRVLIIDDLVATGGTLGSAISLVKMMEGVVVECACVVELKMFINPPDDSGLPSRTKLFEKLGHSDVPVWGLISEDVLTNEATLVKDYIDDGEGH